MKVLILGSLGMLGQELVKAFSESNAVTAWDKEDLDITNFGLVKSELAKLGPAVVINAVAYNDVNGAESNASLADSINGDAVGNLAAVCNNLGAVLVHFSTDYVFDGNKKDGYAESDAPAPLSAYGKSKLRGETQIKESCNMYYIIRLSRLFGRKGNGKDSVVNAMVARLDTTGRIEAPDTERSCLTYAPDLAAATLALVNAGHECCQFGIYHLTNTGATTWFGLAEKIVTVLGKGEAVKADSGKFSRAARIPEFSVLLNTKGPRLRPWPEALAEYLKRK